MMPKVLSDEELSLVVDIGDRVYLEIINGMSLSELRAFDIYCPRDFKHYNSIQCNWLRTEKYLLSNRGNIFREISESELIEDIEKCNNGERFRVFYVMKYPNRVYNVEWKDFS